MALKGKSNGKRVPKAKIRWTKRELENLARLASRPKADPPTEALIRAMQD